MIGRLGFLPLIFAAWHICLRAAPVWSNDKRADPDAVSHCTDCALAIYNNTYRNPQGFWPPRKTSVSDAAAIDRNSREGHDFDDVVLMAPAICSETIRAFSKQALQQTGRTEQDCTARVWPAPWSHCADTH